MRFFFLCLFNFLSLHKFRYVVQNKNDSASFYKIHSAFKLGLGVVLNDLQSRDIPQNILNCTAHFTNMYKERRRIQRKTKGAEKNGLRSRVVTTFL